MITDEQKEERVFELSAGLRDTGKQIVKRLQRGEIDVPLFPNIATEVMRLANSPDSNASELAQLIQSDLTLAGHVIRVANSAMYTPNASMVSLQQAIARLGMNLICEIALSVALNSKLFNAPGFESRLSYISQLSFCTAMWSKEIARLAQSNVESAFLCGLLSGIGRAAFLQAFSDHKVNSGLKLEKEQVSELEDVLHPLFGQEINVSWDMPEVVCTTALYCEDYTKAEKFRQASAIVYAATRLAELSLLGEKLDKVFDDPVFQDLNLYQEQLDSLVEKREPILATVRSRQL